MGWDGYKIHLTETCAGAGSMNLITSVATTAAPVPDAVMTTPVHDMLTAAGLAPREHAADAGYISAQLLLDAAARGITLTGPLAAGTSPQAQASGYTTDMFTIDWDHQQVTCPQGTLSARWNPAQQRGTEVIVVQFPRPPAGPARPAASAPAQRGAGGNYLCGPGRSTTRPWPPAPNRPPGSGKTATPSAPASRAPSARPPRHRPPHRPLPGPAQDQPGTRRRRRSHQPDPAGRLVDQQPAQPCPSVRPTSTAQPHHRRMTQ